MFIWISYSNFYEYSLFLMELPPFEDWQQIWVFKVVDWTFIKTAIQIIITVWGPIMGSMVQLMGMFHSFALMVNSLINLTLILHRHSIRKVPTAQCIKFQPSARIRTLWKSRRKHGMTIVILHLEAAIQGGQFPKAQISPMFMATK